MCSERALAISRLFDHVRVVWVCMWLSVHVLHTDIVNVRMYIVHVDTYIVHVRMYISCIQPLNNRIWSLSRTHTRALSLSVTRTALVCSLANH
jgi:hypothetical protein